MRRREAHVREQPSHSSGVAGLVEQLKASAQARLCLGDRFYADAVSLSYYSVLHDATAVLQLHRIETNSHAAAKTMFDLRIVRTSLPRAEIRPLRFDSLHRLTPTPADYDATASFDETDARDSCDRSQPSFLDRIRLHSWQPPLATGAARSSGLPSVTPSPPNLCAHQSQS